MIEIKAPQVFNALKLIYVYLAGSIDEGAAEPWQQKFVQEFKDDPRICFYNPRRDVWDMTEDVRKQVLWELNFLDESDIIVMYFSPDSKSPITLLELGLYCQTGKLLVCCPDAFYRSINVNIVCEDQGVPLARTMDELVNLLNAKIEEEYGE